MLRTKRGRSRRSEHPLWAVSAYRTKKVPTGADTRQRDFQTFFAAKATAANISLVRGLLKILDVDFKRRATRRKAMHLLAAHEKNLKPNSSAIDQTEETNIVALAISCGLIGLCFLFAAHIEYLSTL